jgi:hypothetical protein
MASPDEQPEETVFLLERFAAVFNLTFTRFNDLKIAEAHCITGRTGFDRNQSSKEKSRRSTNSAAGYTKATNPIRKNGFTG